MEENSPSLSNFLNDIEKIINQPDAGALDILSTLFNMPDEQFEIIRPVLQESLEEAFNEPTSRLKLIAELEQNNLSIIDLVNNIDEYINALSESSEFNLSDSKKDFLRYLFSTAANSLSNEPLNPNRNIKIQVEICNENAKLPTYATDGSAAMDIYSPEEIEILPGETKIIPTGIKVNIPKGYALLIHPRSGISARSKLRIPNSIGLIDSDYHEEIGVIVENIAPLVRDVDIDTMYDTTQLIKEYGSSIIIGKGERFAQMRLVEAPHVIWEPVNSLGTFNDEDDHGKGFGSTGSN